MLEIRNQSSVAPAQTVPVDPQFEGALDQTRRPGAKASQAQLDSLKKATEEFEAMFLGYLLKVMRSTVETEPTPEGSSLGKEIYADLFDNEIALSIARSRGIGIGDMMYEQLKDQEGARVSRQDIPVERSSIPPPAMPITTPATPTIPDTPITSAPAEVVGSLSPRPLPVNGSVSSKYGPRTDPFTGARQFHKGIDIAAPSGTPFHAASSGTVVFAGVLGTYGNTIVIENSNGDRSLYAHAAHLMVRAGDAVNEAQVIGLVGSTGRSTGSHLHFEAQVKGQPVDPQVLLAAGDIRKDPGLKISSKVPSHSHDK